MRPALLVTMALGLVAPAVAASDDRGIVDEDEHESSRSNDGSEQAILRAAELRMFGRGSSLDRARTRRSVVRIGRFSSAVSSEIRGAPFETTRESTRDLAWLSGLALPDLPVRWDERVLRYLEFFRNDPRGRSLMTAWLSRAAAYAPMIRSELRAHGLPEDLLYVAMIESGFDLRARSSASAIGLWQFVARTGSEYGLRIDRWVDERNDPVLSTRAAARFLRDLHNRLRTWELALAAYNMGYGALVRTLRKYNANDYWVLTRTEAALPFETTLYVAKAMACAVVGRNAALFGFQEIESSAAPSIATVNVPGGTTLGMIAKAAGVDAETLATLNPSLLRQRTPPTEVSHAVRLPAEKVEAFAKRWTQMRPTAPATRTHVVQFGESIEDVARRYRTTPATLRRLNELEPSVPLRPGHRVLVPAVEPIARDPAPPVVTVPPGTFRYPGRKRIFYRVQAGDTLSEITRFFGVTLDDVRRWNAVDPSTNLLRGMVLQLFVPSDLEVDEASVFRENEVRVLALGSDAFFDYHEEQRGRVRMKYVTRPGDSLATIARRFGLKVTDLTRINRFGQSTALAPGQEIVVYAPRGKAPDRGRPEAPSDREDATGDDTRWANFEP